MGKKLSKKQQIAEKLLADQPLEGEEIVWLLSHLPDNDKKGLNNPLPFFDHNEKMVSRAIGIDDDEWNKRLFLVMGDFEQYLLKGKLTPSEVIEKWISYNDYDLLKFICYMCIEKFMTDYLYIAESFGEKRKAPLKRLVFDNSKTR